MPRFRPPLFAALLVVAGIALCAASTRAIEIQLMTRIKGQEKNTLSGVGLVVSLDGTGATTKKSALLLEPLARLYRAHGIEVPALSDLAGTDSACFVWIDAEVPGQGAYEGDVLDARVAIQDDATSLEGGTLVSTPLRVGTSGPIYALVTGRIEVDPENPRRGVIRDGVTMMRSVEPALLAAGSDVVRLVLDEPYAMYPVAQAIAARITQEFAIDARTTGEVTARAAGPRLVEVRLGERARAAPVPVVAHIQTLDIDPRLRRLPPRVVIDEARGTIVVTGDVEISDVVVTTRGLTITRIEPEQPPTPAAPRRTVRRHVAIGTGAPEPGRPRLQDLLDALDRLEVPFDERVQVLRQLHVAGSLHAELIEA